MGVGGWGRLAFAAAGAWFSIGADGAERWALQYFYDKEDSSLALVDLQFPTARRGVAVGVITERRRRNPVAVLTGDGGRSWETLPLQEAAIALFFLNEQAGWMVSEKGRLWKTTEAGRNWTPVKLEGVRPQPRRVFFADESRGWLLCAQRQVYRTEDGGRKWQPVAVALDSGPPPEITVFDRAAFRGPVGLLTAWSRAPRDGSRLPDWMEPDLATRRQGPTTGVLLRTLDSGQTWSSHQLSRGGQIVRALISPAGQALLLVQRPDSTEAASMILSMDMQNLGMKPLYVEPTRWLTDLALLGDGRLLAAAIDQQARGPAPPIPLRLKVLESRDGSLWTEMEVDYRAEARRAVLASAEGAAWIATDTGMILRLEKSEVGSQKPE